LNGASGLPGILGFGYAWRADVWMFSLLDAGPWRSGFSYVSVAAWYRKAGFYKQRY